MSALERARKVYNAPVACARAYRDRGGRLIGYFCDSLPLEIIDAAGFIPHRVTGYPAPPGDVLDRRLFALLPKSFWQVRQNSLEFVNHSFGRIVDGTYDFLDVVVIPNTRKPLLNLYGQLADAQADDPSLKIPKAIVLDRAATQAPSTSAFNRDSIDLFWSRMEDLAGRKISDADVSRSIKTRREIREALQILINWRREPAPRLSGTDFLAVAGASMFMAAADFLELVREIIAEGPLLPRRTARVFVGGSPPDNDVLYRIIESTGATVVGEDHCWGERCADLQPLAPADPRALLAARWSTSAACAFRLPYKATLDNIVARARAARADAVILNVFRDDEMQVWDTPGQIEALQRGGLPVLHLSEQPHVIETICQLTDKISAFLERAGAPAEGGDV